MSSKQDDRQIESHSDATYTEASTFGFDHPNVKVMDDQYLVTMNNEHIKRGYIASADIEVVKAEIRVMGSLERLYAGGYYDVDTARAIEAGAFTLERAIESARDGFFVRLEHSQYNYEVLSAPKKQGGFLNGLNPFKKKEEPQMYAGERQR
jgi:hypothetical protein